MQECFIFVPMNDVDEFMAWAKTVRQSLDSVINKSEEKIDFSEEDLVFLEKAHRVFENGDLE